MSGFLDTSVVVRYLTGEPRELAEKAARIIDSKEELWLTDVVITEIAYVLTSVYRIPRETVVDYLIPFIQKRNMTVFGLDKSLVVEGLLLCRSSNRVSFADALLWTVARSGAEKVVYSFDERFPTEGIDLRRSRR